MTLDELEALAMKNHAGCDHAYTWVTADGETLDVMMLDGLCAKCEMPVHNAQSVKLNTDTIKRLIKAYRVLEKGLNRARDMMPDRSLDEAMWPQITLDQTLTEARDIFEGGGDVN